MPRLHRPEIPDSVFQEVAEEIVAAERQNDRALAVLHAARVWRVARHGRVVGDTFSKACRALDDAVALFEGHEVSNPAPPPTSEELAKSKALADRLRERTEHDRP